MIYYWASHGCHPSPFRGFWALFGQKAPKRTGMTSLGFPGLSSQSVSGLFGPFRPENPKTTSLGFPGLSSQSVSGFLGPFRPENPKTDSDPSPIRRFVALFGQKTPKRSGMTSLSFMSQCLEVALGWAGPPRGNALGSLLAHRGPPSRHANANCFHGCRVARKILQRCSRRRVLGMINHWDRKLIVDNLASRDPSLKQHVQINILSCSSPADVQEDSMAYCYSKSNTEAQTTYTLSLYALYIQSSHRAGT